MEIVLEEYLEIKKEGLVTNNLEAFVADLWVVVLSWLKGQRLGGELWAMQPNCPYRQMRVNDPHHLFLPHFFITFISAPSKQIIRNSAYSSF